MDENDLIGVALTDLDLNQEPADPSMHRATRYGSMLNDLETSNRIEERLRWLRRLRAIAARVRQRQPRNNTETSHPTSEAMVVDEVQRAGVNANPGIVERGPDRGKGCKRDSSHLKAKALGIEPEEKKANKDDDGRFYDCSICLELAREPVLTNCGHLFCWPCFYRVSKVDSATKECPVCKGAVSDSSVIPIYGDGDTERGAWEEFGFTIPPRPKARRVESTRQQNVTQGLSHVRVAEALERLRTSTGSINSQRHGQLGVRSSGSDPRAGQNTEPTAAARVRVHQVSRVLSESAASLTSLSSALSNAQRLVEGLEVAINNRLRNHARAMIHNATNSSDRSSSLLNAVSSLSTDVPGYAPGLVNYGNSSNVSLPTSSDPNIAIHRRLRLARILDRNSPDSRESRRRRLN